MEKILSRYHIAGESMNRRTMLGASLGLLGTLSGADRFFHAHVPEPDVTLCIEGPDSKKSVIVELENGIEFQFWSVPQNPLPNGTAEWMNSSHMPCSRCCNDDQNINMKEWNHYWNMAFLRAYPVLIQNFPQLDHENMRELKEITERALAV